MSFYVRIPKNINQNEKIIEVIKNLKKEGAIPRCFYQNEKNFLIEIGNVEKIDKTKYDVIIEKGFNLLH